MPQSNVHDVRTWSRSCDVAVHVYRVLNELRDRNFATRVIQNAFLIPEAVAAAVNPSRPQNRYDALSRSLDALAILQTQLYLASECGLLAAEHMNAICREAADLFSDLQAQQFAGVTSRDG